MKSFARAAFVALFCALLLIACNSGGSDTISNQGSSDSGSSGGSTPSTPQQPSSGSSSETPSVASLTVRTDTTQIPSDGSKKATITALAKDANNNVIKGVPIQFKADSGTLAVTQGTTDATGTATAMLSTADNPATRTIQVQADGGRKSDSVNVQVVGTQLSINGPSALTTNQAGDFNLTLQDAGGNPLPGRRVTFTSPSAANFLSQPQNTDSKGQVEFKLKPVQGGKQAITATALGAVGTKSITVSSDFFDLTVGGPGCTSKQGSNTVIPLNTNCSLTATWKNAGAPQTGKIISFASTRGNFSPNTQTTNSQGQAKVTIASTTAGPAAITATTPPGGPSIQIPVQFVAVSPASIVLNADNSTIAPQGTATLNATVRDSNDNPVYNAKVNFAITSGTSGGSLSQPSATTNLNGEAQTVYTAGANTSAKDGVQVQAVVYNSSGNQVSQDTVPLTVSSKALDLTLGTGNKVDSPNDQQYKQPYVVQVADASGNPVAGAQVTLSLNPPKPIDGDSYQKGCWQSYSAGSPPASSPVPCKNPTHPSVTASGALGTHTDKYAQYVTAVCANEDTNRNGILDAGEDFNGDGKLEPGIPATVQPKTVATDATGTADFGILYPKNYAYWAAVKLTATAKVSGTERSKTAQFLLQGLNDDYKDSSVSVPGMVSPYGVGPCNSQF